MLIRYGNSPMVVAECFLPNSHRSNPTVIRRVKRRKTMNMGTFKPPVPAEDHSEFDRMQSRKGQTHPRKTWNTNSTLCLLPGYNGQQNHLFSVCSTRIRPLTGWLSLQCSTRIHCIEQSLDCFSPVCLLSTLPFPANSPSGPKGLKKQSSNPNCANKPCHTQEVGIHI